MRARSCGSMIIWEGIFPQF